MTRTLICSTLLTAAVLAAAGSAGDVEPEGKLLPLDARAREALAALGAGVVGRALPALPLERPDALLRTVSGEFEFAFTEGADHGRKRASERVTRKGERGERISMTRSLGVDITEELVVDPDGTVRIVSEADGEYGYRVVLDPGLVIRSGLEPGETWEVVNTLRVYAPEEPDEVSYTGTMKSVLRYAGRYEVTTPAGTFDAVLFSEHRQIDVGPVHISDERYEFFSEGVGKIASVEGVRLSALFVVNLSDRTAKVLVRSPTQPAEAGARPELRPPPTD